MSDVTAHFFRDVRLGGAALRQAGTAEQRIKDGNILVQVWRNGFHGRQFSYGGRCRRTRHTYIDGEKWCAPLSNTARSLPEGGSNGFPPPEHLDKIVEERKWSGS